jgi:hypothetical protein
MILAKTITLMSLASWTHDAKCRILQLRQSPIPHNWPNDAFYQFQAMLQSTLMHTDTDVICFDSREVWVTPFAGRKYDSLQAQAIISLPEIIAAFPQP